MTTLKNPIQMLEHWEAVFPDQVYLRQSTGKDWIEYTWKMVADRTRRVAHYIDQQGFPKGSTIAIWSTNSVDWVIADLAIMMSGHISVPIYPAQDKESAKYIIEHSEPKLVFGGTFDQAPNLHSIIPAGVSTVSMHGASIECDTSMDEIVETIEPKNDFDAIELENIYTIIYSSGTSGKPKGVMLTYDAIAKVPPILTNAYDRPVCNKPGDKRERVISYLPMSHAAERSLIVIASLYINSCVSVSAGLEHFSAEMVSVKPTLFGSVPRIWFKFMQGIEAAFKAQGKSIETEEDKETVRRMLGLECVENIVTGTAPVSPTVHKWFANLGLYLRESYGMTETFAYGTIWSGDEPPMPGCVGKAIEGIELKLDDNNEIHLKTPVIMKGYYKEEGKTAEVLNDGWYATGDLGRLDENGNLWLTGRAGSIFKTSKGKFINPERIEGELQKTIVADQLMVFGHGLAQPVAIANVAEAGQGKTNEQLIAYFNTHLDQLNETLPPYEKVNSLLLVRDSWTVDDGYITPTLKVKRKAVEISYGSKVDGSIAGAFFES